MRVFADLDGRPELVGTCALILPNRGGPLPAELRTVRRINNGYVEFDYWALGLVGTVAEGSLNYESVIQLRSEDDPALLPDWKGMT